VRIALVPFVVLAASWSLAAAPSATTDPVLDDQRIDMTIRPVPVHVVNLPAVQTVGGTVNVGNLPLDSGGAVRVTSAPARQMVWQELISEPVSYSGDLLLSAVVNADGYSSVGVLVIDNSDARVDVFWQWAGDEGFTPVADTRNGFQGVGSYEVPFRCGGLANVRLICPNSVGNLRVRLHNPSGVSTATSVRVYLFP
jgi:hypothetical protein